MLSPSALRSALPILLLALPFGCRHDRAAVTPGMDALTTAAAHPDGLGALVYTGEVAPLARPGDPIFGYERRVRHDEDVTHATHLTRDLVGHAVVMQTATIRDGNLVSFTAVQAQRGTVGELKIDSSGTADYVLDGPRGRRSRREPNRGPVVVGPTLYGFVRAHWDELARGEPVALRFAVVEDLRSYAFTLRRASSDGDTTVVVMRADSPFVRAAVAPMRLTFATASQQILRYDGRVPPLLPVGRRLRPLDARVIYLFGPTGDSR